MKEKIIHEKVIFQTLKEPRIRRLLAENVASAASIELDAEDVSYKVLITRDTATTGYEAKVTITQDLSNQMNNEFTVICAKRDMTRDNTYHISVAAESSAEAAKDALSCCAEDWECEVDDLIVVGMYRGTVSPVIWDDSGFTLDEIPEL